MSLELNSCECITKCTSRRTERDSLFQR